MVAFVVFSVLAAFVYVIRPTRDPVRIRARSTGMLSEDDYIAHALAVRKRRAAIRYQRREFDRHIRAHLEKCELKWREKGWRPAGEKWEPLAFKPALGERT
jgi:hypothetical protein